MSRPRFSALCSSLPFGCFSLVRFTSKSRAIRKDGTTAFLETAREYGLVQIVRTEKTTYRRKTLVVINPKTKEVYTEDQLDDIWCRKLSREFGLTFNGYLPGYSDLRRFMDRAEVEFEGYRNVFSVNWAKFEKMCQGL